MKVSAGNIEEGRTRISVKELKPSYTQRPRLIARDTQAKGQAPQRPRVKGQRHPTHTQKHPHATHVKSHKSKKKGMWAKSQEGGSEKA